MTLEEWVHLNGDQLLRYAHLVCSPDQEAQDVVQDVLLHVSRRWEQRLSEVDDMLAYLKRAVLNESRSGIRSRVRRTVHEFRATQSSSPTETDPEDRVSLTDLVWRACTSLPRRQRVALVLRYYEDLPYGEIAKILDCTESSARVLVSRALTQLRQNVALVEDHDGR